MKPETVARYIAKDGFHLIGGPPEKFWEGPSGSELFRAMTREYGPCVFKHNYNRMWLRQEGLQTQLLIARRKNTIYRPVHWSARTHLLAELIPNAEDIAQILRKGVARSRRQAVLRAIDVVLAEMVALWTAHPVRQEDVQSLYRSMVLGDKRRARRVVPLGRAGQRVRRLLRQVSALHLPIVVNGQELDMTTHQLLRNIHTTLATPLSAGRLLHGDLRPDNILLSQNNEEVRLIDPRVGETDWARETGLFARTQNLLTVQSMHDARLKVARGRLVLNYIPHFDPLCATIADHVYQRGATFAQAIEDPAWYTRAQMHIASVYINDIRIYGRQQRGTSQIPELVAYLLGEAALAVARAQAGYAAFR